MRRIIPAHPFQPREMPHTETTGTHATSHRSILPRIELHLLHHHLERMTILLHHNRLCPAFKGPLLNRD